jgi:S1/P1 Nuclease
MTTTRSHTSLGRPHVGSTFLGIALALILAQPRGALAWGPEGHQVVGSIADQLLHDHAKQEVANILGFELRVAATWPDCAKDVVHHPNGTFEYKPDPHFAESCASFATESKQMIDYVTRNWSNCTYEDKPANCHKAFHFADVAIQHDTYDRKDVGTSDHDVVSAINAIILVLQNKPAPRPFSIKDQKEALFLLAHFVGDLHQPLHVGAIYLNAAGNPVNPDVGTFDKNSETAGGNRVSGTEHGNLHADWDAIPKRFGTSADQSMVAEAKAISHSSGPLESWAAAWASDTVIAAHSAFKGLGFAATGGAHSWSVEFDNPSTYENGANQLKEKQLAKAGARLAELLNAIWP